MLPGSLVFIMVQYDLNNLGRGSPAHYFEIGPEVFAKNIFKIFKLVVMPTRIMHKMEIFKQI